jgi:hypothetical protein
MVRWGGLGKINVHIVYNSYFFKSRKVSYLWFMKHCQTKENWKNNACPFIKSYSLWYGSGFFFKIKYYYAFIIKQMQKNTFLEWNFIQKL